MENNNYLPVLNIKPEDLPTVITQTVNNLTAIDTKIQQSEEKAIIAADTAKIAKSKSAGWSLFGTDKEKAIKALQNAVSDQANALKDSVEASKELFDNQKKMIQSINYLFGLGVSNMAANRTVVRELTLKLQNASKEELSELARKEIEAVIMQLRAQEDMWNRMEKHDSILREHKADIDQTALSLEAVNRTIQTKLDTIEQLKKEVKSSLDSLPNKLTNIQQDLNKTIESRLNVTTNTINNLFNQEKNILSQELVELEKRTKKIEEKINQEIDELLKLENELKAENEKNFDQLKIQLKEEFARIEKQLIKKSFFDSTFYKFIIGVAAITALALQFI